MPASATVFSGVITSLEKMVGVLKTLQEIYGGEDVAAFIDALRKAKGKKRKSKRSGARKVSAKYTDASRKALDVVLAEKIKADKLTTANAIAKASGLTMKVAADLLKKDKLPSGSLSKTIQSAAKWAGFEGLVPVATEDAGTTKSKTGKITKKS